MYFESAVIILCIYCVECSDDSYPDDYPSYYYSGIPTYVIIVAGIMAVIFLFACAWGIIRIFIRNSQRTPIQFVSQSEPAIVTMQSGNCAPQYGNGYPSHAPIQYESFEEVRPSSQAVMTIPYSSSGWPQPAAPSMQYSGQVEHTPSAPSVPSSAMPYTIGWNQSPQAQPPSYEAATHQPNNSSNNSHHYNYT